MFKKTLSTLALCMCLLGANAQVADYNVVPLPQNVTAQKGKPFALTPQTTIVYSGNDQAMKDNANFLAEYIQVITGFKPNVSTQKVKGTNTILLTLNPKVAGNEAYTLTVNDKQVTIAGSTAAGVFYGVQTLRKSLPISETNPKTPQNLQEVSLPAVQISDSPLFGYRGVMLDCCRHFFSVDFIKRYLDILAMHNINTFHWHLSDDQGWRIEIKKYPKLTEIGSKRTETVLPGDKGYDGTPVSGYYTQEEARELVKYAAERFITIIPEIDMPGHIQSALAAYPELGCTGGPYPVCTHFGVIKEVLCAGNPKALQLAKDVVNEIMDIFPSEYIHLGGDECPKDRWKECAKCQQKIKDLNLKDEEKHSKEELLQTWFMGELEKDIRARGRKMIAWDEILDGSPSKTVTVIGWTSKDASIRSARQGYPTVVAPITNFYFSNPRINKIEGIPSIQRVYDLDPCFDVLTPEEQKNIIGAEGCIWTEWVKDSTKLEWQLLPRLAALCEVQWTPKDKRNLDNFFSRMFHMQELYQLKKMNYRKDIGEDVLKSKESKGFFCK